jgi:glycosyltransferase involved in cell wall biosynthesis
MTMTSSPKIRVLHFVTGGFSGGSTQVALGLVRAHLASASIEPLLVLRRKRRADPARVQQLRDDGIPLETVNDITHISTIWALIKVIKRFKPDILVAHGFSEHIWGRWAGLLAKVPVMIHVEHNTRERYTWWRLQQAHFLTRYTARIVGVSEGVREVMVGRGFPAEKCIAIPNGINLAPFAELNAPAFADREAAVMMVSRFAKQNDHHTLVQALAILRERGITLPACNRLKA